MILNWNREIKSNGPMMQSKERRQQKQMKIRAKRKRSKSLSICVLYRPSLKVEVSTLQSQIQADTIIKHSV